ncbi:MAG: PAS domain S-box protein [Isosphaeraceae bacterium]|nr:PAS domain S-box protein [Isosphaeraceae bacterium]
MSQDHVPPLSEEPSSAPGQTGPSGAPEPEDDRVWGEMLAEAMPQVVWTAGPNGEVDYFNTRWYAYTGMTPAEALAHEGWRGVVHPDDLGRVYALRNRAVGSGEMFQAEVRLRDRDGRYRWHLIHSVPVRAPSGRVTRRLGTAIDIDDRVRTEEALRASEEEHRALYNQAATGIAEVDLSGRFLRANDRYCEIVGYPREDLLALRFQDITHPDDLARNLSMFERVAEELPQYTIEKRYVRKDGREVWARTAVSLIRDGAGKPARVAAIIEDVTERKRLEGELGRRMDELADADRRKDEFLAILAHELRNPLAPIRNALHLMRRPGGDEPERAMAERQVAHLVRLVDDLMDVSRISQGKIDLRTETVELQRIVTRAVETARAAIDARGLELSIALPAVPVRLKADPTRLEQVVDNLLTNAVKYTEPGGQIQVSLDREGEEAVLRVRDTGIGIPADMLPRVFEMFVQVERRPERSQGGLGIGLGIVKSLVELHGGRVEALSAGRGQGSEFVVRLPIVAQEPLAPPEPTDATDDEGPIADVGLRRRRVLVVDDNVDAANSLAKLLDRLYGQETRVAFDGPSALALTTSFRPEVVLLDIGMPGMDGYQVARRLRDDPASRKATLVALTGWGQENDRRRSKMAGFDHHLVKPVDLEDLRTILRAQPESV